VAGAEVAVGAGELSRSLRISSVCWVMRWCARSRRRCREASEARVKVVLWVHLHASLSPDPAAPD
jgi:hypothetical protein